MTTDCYAMVRGSAIRVTSLNRRGEYDPDNLRHAVSKTVARVVINEVTTEGSNNVERNEEEEARLLLIRPTQTLRYTVDIDFLRVDPGLLNLVTGVPLVTAERPILNYGFGEGPYGLIPFGGGKVVGEPLETQTSVVGFDANTRLPVTSFALEVWSKLAGAACAEGPRWGYTLFPFLKGGRLSGFQFANGLVSFSLRGAQTRRLPKWGLGPYDIDGPGVGLIEPVTRSTNWRTTVVSQAPPQQTDGVIESVAS